MIYFVDELWTRRPNFYLFRSDPIDVLLEQLNERLAVVRVTCPNIDKTRHFITPLISQDNIFMFLDHLIISNGFCKSMAVP